MDESSIIFPTPPSLRYDLVENAEFPPLTSNHNNVPHLDGNQPVASHAVTYHGPNYVDHGHWAQGRASDDLYIDNLWYEGPPPAVVANSEGQFTYQTNTNIGYPAHGNTQHMVIPPGPSRGEYYIPPAHDIPSNGVRDRLPPSPVAQEAFSRSVPESTPSGMSAMEGLKRLSDRYLHDPSSQVQTLRMGLSPSTGRLRVMIMLDIEI